MTDFDANATRVLAVSPGGGRTFVLRMAVGLGIGAVFVVTFLRLVNFSSVSRRLEHLDLGLAFLCGAVFLGAYVVRALRWRRLLVPDIVSVPRTIAIYFVAIFVNWLLPIRGGELAKSLMLRRSNAIPVSRSLATVTVDKAMDLLPAVALLAVVPFAGLHLSRSLWLLLLAALLVLACGVLVLGLASWRRGGTVTWLSRILAAILPRRVSEHAGPFVVRFIDTMLALGRKPRILLIAGIYTAAAVCLDALFCYLAFRAVGVSVQIPIVLYGYTFYNLAYILPTPPGQIGSNELIGLLIFTGMFGVSRSAVGAMFLFSHPWTAILMAGSGLVSLSAMGLSLRATFALPAAEEVRAE
jgi:uncharacterized protein (TIRG00374 family)